MEKQKKKDNENERNKRIIMYIIIIILVILSLITSCSCTSKFFGKLGNNNRSDDYSIDNDTNDMETIRNQELKFDEERMNISLSDSKVMASFTYRNISPEVFYCNTSNPSIATCYVSDGYVVINPKSLGEVTIILQTTTNGKIYEATMTVNVTDVTRYIELSSNSGTIDLKNTRSKNISYILVGLNGDINVTSSDSSIATATVSNGYLKITAYKEGTVTFTLSLMYNGYEYTNTYTLKIIDTSSSSSNSPNVERYINLASSSGSIDLNTASTKNVQYTLVNLSGNVSVTSSDPSIATATANNGILKITAYKEGTVKLTLSLTYNGTTYSTIYTLSVNEDRYINLASSSGSIDLNTTNTKSVQYTLVNLSGNVSVTSSDSSVATATVSNGILKINAYKEGIAKFTLSLTYNGKLYSTDYTLMVFNSNSSESKSSDVSLKLLNVNGISVLNTYYITVKDTPAKLSAIPNNQNAKIIYNGTRYNSLDDIELELKEGYNTVNFVVEAEDGTTLVYKVIINYDKDASGDDTNKFVLNIPNSADLRYTSNGGEKVFTIGTSNLFVGNVQVSSYDGSGLKICSPTDDTCIYVTIPKEYSDYLKLESNNDSLLGPSSLAIKVSVNTNKIDELTKLPSIPLTVWGTKNGENITIGDISNPTKDVTINLIRCYIVELNANGGQFRDNSTDVYKFEISASEKIDIKEYTPYKLAEDCIYYTFIGYSPTASQTDIKYNPNEVIQNLSQDLKLYAVYTVDKEGTGDPILKVSWTDTNPMFKNEQATSFSNIEDLIYPGAYGTYTMNFTNNSDYAIVLENLILKEETICLDTNNVGTKDRCLNMGYIVSIDPAPATTRAFNYYYGASGDGYKILNKNATSTDYDNNTNSVKLDLTNQGKITIPKDGEFTIMISWKWLEENNKLDTMIGEEAFKGANQYSLNIGLEYYTEADVCESSESNDNESG